MLVVYLKRIFFLCTIIILTGCSSGAFEAIRKVTYPPDFNYISSDNLTSTMQQFAWYTTLLDNSMRDTLPVPESQRLNAISILGKMEKLSHDLGEDNLSSNHNIVSFNITQFRQSIINARDGLLIDPPNYYLAGSVSAYCLNCHALKR